MNTELISRTERTTEKTVTDNAAYTFETERTDGRVRYVRVKATRVVDAGFAPDGSPVTASEDLGTVLWESGRISTSGMVLDESTATVIAEIHSIILHVTEDA